MNMPTLSDILNKKIGEGGKSKAYVANALGVGEKTIENYMRGLRNPKPDALVKLSQVLKFDLSQLSEQSVPNATVKAQTPQIGRITQLVRDIQYGTFPSLSLEQIADKIGYSREHLNRLTTKQEDSEKVYNLLMTEFEKEIKAVKQSSDKLTTSTNKPVFDVKTTGSPTDKDATISNLSTATKSQQETIAKLTDNLIALTTKVIEKL